jgi:ketosteroid isomerase-like protein
MDYLQKQFFAEDVRFHLPGRSLLAGVYEGPQQVMQLFARLFELTGGTFSVELHDVLANDEHAAALYTIRGERAGKQQLNDNQVQIFHIRGGKASEVWAQATDLYTLDEFFS